MKIAMVGQFYPHIGGVGVHIHSLAKELVKQGHEIYVITYPHKDIKDIDGIHVIGTKGVNIPGLRGLMFSVNAKKTLEELVKKEKIDLIHGHYLFPAGFACVKVGKKYNIPTYVTAHGSDMFELYKKQKYIRPVIKKVLKDADHVCVVSEALKEEVLKTNVKGLTDKLSINWNSVDTDKFKPDNDYKFKKELIEKYNIPEDVPLVLFVGNLIKRKNVKSFIKAKKHVNKESVFVIVGDGPLYNDLTEYVETNNIENVIFTGSRNDIENIIPSCDLLVLPSHSESFGLVLIEALSCGKPVIGSNVGGIREIITPDVGLLVDGECPIKIGEGISRILNDDDLRSRFESNSRNRAKDFSKVQIPYDNI